MGIYQGAGYFWEGWVFMLEVGLWILGQIEMDGSENIVLFREIGFWVTGWYYGRLVGVIFRVQDGREEGGTKVEAVEGFWVGIGAIDS